jgi:AraC-like DNA-binding protein
MRCEGKKDFAMTQLDSNTLLLMSRIPHRQEGYNISILLRGTISKYIDFEKHIVQAPAIIFIGPEQVHQYVEVANAEMLCISFHKDFIIGEMMGWMACWECMFGHAVMNLDEKRFADLKPYIDLLQDEYERNESKKEMVLRNILTAFIVSCARLKQRNDTVMHMDLTQNKTVLSFKALVDTHFREKTQVAHYADMLSVTPGHLNDVIKSTVGKTAKQVIDEKRIAEAKRLLFWGEENMKEIAWRLNFEDDSYFNRFFKKHTGQTPSIFQRMIREKYN